MYMQCKIQDTEFSNPKLFAQGLEKSHYMYSSGPSFEFETENPDNNDDVRAKIVSNSLKKDVPSINQGETLKRCGYDANGRR